VLSLGGVTINAIVDHPTGASGLPLLKPAAVDSLLDGIDPIELTTDSRNQKKFTHGLRG